MFDGHMICVLGKFEAKWGQRKAPLIPGSLFRRSLRWEWWGAWKPCSRALRAQRLLGFWCQSMDIVGRNHDPQQCWVHPARRSLSSEPHSCQQHVGKHFHHDMFQVSILCTSWDFMGHTCTYIYKHYFPTFCKAGNLPEFLKHNL